jgi:hypothetical protein
MFTFLDDKKQAKIQWLYYPDQSNLDNLNNVGLEGSRNFTNNTRNTGKLKLMKLKLTARLIISQTRTGHQ